MQFQGVLNYFQVFMSFTVLYFIIWDDQRDLFWHDEWRLFMVTLVQDRVLRWPEWRLSKVVKLNVFSRPAVRGSLLFFMCIYCRNLYFIIWTNWFLCHWVPYKLHSEHMTSYGTKVLLTVCVWSHQYKHPSASPETLFYVQSATEMGRSKCQRETGASWCRDTEATESASVSAQFLREEQSVSAAVLHEWSDWSLRRRCIKQMSEHCPKLSKPTRFPLHLHHSFTCFKRHKV